MWEGGLADGSFGPDLTHFASRDTLASGAVTNTPAHVAQWIKGPAHYKEGALMPAMYLDDGQIARVTAYLESLRLRLRLDDGQPRLTNPMLTTSLPAMRWTRLAATSSWNTSMSG